MAADVIQIFEEGGGRRRPIRRRKAEGGGPICLGVLMFEHAGSLFSMSTVK